MIIPEMIATAARKAKTMYNRFIPSICYSPLSIVIPIYSNNKNEIAPAMTKPILNPEIKGPIMRVATQILAMSSSVFAKFSSWRLVNFIAFNNNILMQDCQARLRSNKMWNSDLVSSSDSKKWVRKQRPENF